MKFNAIILSLGLLLTCGCKTVSAAENSINATLTKDVLSCVPKNEVFRDLFSESIDSIIDGKKLPSIQNNTLVFAGIPLSGVKKISYGSKTEEIPNNSLVVKSDLLHFDIDTTTLGLHILRVSFFEAEGFTHNGLEFESNGYYFIVQGNISSAKAAWKKNKLYIDAVTIEQTKGGNTRVRCVMSG